MNDMLVYSGRMSATAIMRVGLFCQASMRGGQRHEAPCYHALDEYVAARIRTAVSATTKKRDTVSEHSYLF